VNKQTRKMLNDTEQELLRLTEADALKELDEDALIDLHTRVRRARTKYTKLYRRRAAAQVSADATRGRASKVNQRTALKAEVFEDALARVSRRLARVAWISADRLREERLQAARAAKRKAASAKENAKKGKGKGSGKGPKGAKPASADKKLRSGSSKRDAAAARAATRRTQAKRDKR
jgi:hypothetical protein